MCAYSDDIENDGADTEEREKGRENVCKVKRTDPARDKVRHRLDLLLLFAVAARHVGDRKVTLREKGGKYKEWVSECVHQINVRGCSTSTERCDFVR